MQLSLNARLENCCHRNVGVAFCSVIVAEGLNSKIGSNLSKNFFIDNSIAQINQNIDGPHRCIEFSCWIIVVAIDQGLGSPRLTLRRNWIENIVVDRHIQKPQVLQQFFSSLQCRQLVARGRFAQSLGVSFEDGRRLGPTIPQGCLHENGSYAIPFFFLQKGGYGFQLGLCLNNESAGLLHIVFGRCNCNGWKCRCGQNCDCNFGQDLSSRLVSPSLAITFIDTSKRIFVV